MVKGPKAILSHAIADALAEYFEVDPKAIESNLITNAKIVLRNAKLREQDIHSNQTVATVTGSVDEVSFTWKWTLPSESKTKNATDAGWVKDAVLTIKGLRLKTHDVGGEPARYWDRQGSCSLRRSGAASGAHSTCFHGSRTYR